MWTLNGMARSIKFHIRLPTLGSHGSLCTLLYSFGVGADHLTFEGGGGVIYCSLLAGNIFFWDCYMQDFFPYPITMYDFFCHSLFRSIFFNSLYYLDSLIIVNVEFSSFMHCS